MGNHKISGHLTVTAFDGVYQSQMLAAQQERVVPIELKADIV